MRVIAIQNTKGGVAKTTTSINIAAKLAMLGCKTLLIDMDAQASASQWSGLFDKIDDVVTIVDCYEGYIENNDIPLPVYRRSDNFDIVLSRPKLAMTELRLVSEPNRELILKNKLVGLEYDYVIIDCPPASGLLTTIALSAATDLIIPINPDGASIDALNIELSFVKNIMRKVNNNLHVLGILVTKLDGRVNLHKEALSFIERQTTVFQTKIRHNIALPECFTKKMTIFEHKPTSIGAEDYNNLAIELINKINK